jgi:hypothetical protein
MSLLTIQDLRARRGQITEQELLKRCKDAARLEMRGSNYSPEDRQDCASQIMVDGLAETKGAPPMADDQRHSLAAYCGRAKNVRRSLIRDRERDQTETEAQSLARAWSIDALMPDDVAEIEPVSEAEAWQMVDKIAARLAIDCDQNIATLFYGYIRDMPGPAIAAELEISANAYDVRCLRAKDKIRKSYPTAKSFLRMLVGEPTIVVDPMTGEPVLRFSRTDDSKAAHDRTHLLAEDWRSGTDGGSWPTRPENAEDARRVCEIRHRSGGRRKPREISPQVEADALLRLGQALSATR